MSNKIKNRKKEKKLSLNQALNALFAELIAQQATTIEIVQAYPVMGHKYVFQFGIKEVLDLDDNEMSVKELKEQDSFKKLNNEPQNQTESDEKGGSSTKQHRK